MAENWYVGRNGNRTGPFTPEQVRQMVASGQIGPADLLWKEGMANWVAASSITGLFVGSRGAVLPPLGVNPYAAPAGSISAEPVAGASSMQYAEYLPRVGASLLDGLFTGLMGCIPVFGITLVFLAGAGNDAESQAVASSAASCCSQLVGQLIGIAYYVVLETSQKQGTWGKQIVGIRVTDLDGNRLTVGRAIGRYFARFLTVFTCGIGLLFPLFTERKQTLHDMVAGCLALKK
ncbi:MAG: RDD family protein [Planctomycetia bacterium]|jgi:uncharacterized RDD family membrane protein YckC